MTNKPVILTKEDIDKAVNTVLLEYRYGKVVVDIEDGVILEIDMHGKKRRVKEQLPLNLKQRT